MSRSSRLRVLTATPGSAKLGVEIGSDTDRRADGVSHPLPW